MFNQEKIPLILTPEFRVAFPAIFVPEAQEGKRPKYSLTMLYPKATDLTPLRDLVKAAILSRWPDKASRPSGLKSPFNDGDAKDWAGFHGHTFIRASSYQQPGLVDRQRQKVIDPERVYPGIWARAQLGAYTYDESGNRGVAFGLFNVQLLRDDEPFIKRRDASEVFDDGTVADAPAARNPGDDENLDNLL